jgi:hypothetical protein
MLATFSPRGVFLKKFNQTFGSRILQATTTCMAKWLDNGRKIDHQRTGRRPSLSLRRRVDCCVIDSTVRKWLQGLGTSRALAMCM